jgi:hypothetical protein
VRTPILAALMLLALAAPLGFAATAEAAPRPVKLKLISLTCHDTEDVLGEDGIELLRNGTAIYANRR